MNSANLTNWTLPTLTAEPASTTWAPLVDVDAGGIPSCSLCPDALPLPDPNRRFINVAVDALNCNGLDNLLQLLDNPADCEENKGAFNGTFDPSIYCHCPAVEPTGLCSLCENGIVLNPDAMINGASCSDYDSLAAASVTAWFCQSILDVVGMDQACCQQVITDAPVDVDSVRSSSSSGARGQGHEVCTNKQSIVVGMTILGFLLLSALFS